LVAAGALLVAGCSAPGSDDGSAGDSSDAAAEEITAPVTPEEVAELGDVTMRIWAEAGEEATLNHLVPIFEKKYPNVTVDVTIKSFDDLTKTVVNAMNSDSAPDLAQGNQGYQVDGALVQAGLVRPLDDVAEAYGWEDDYSEYSLNQFRWNEDGSRWGEGTLYANSPVTQYIGVYYNKDLLAEAGVEPPESWADFEASLPEIKSAGITPIEFGNSDKQAAMHLFGAVSGRCQTADEVNDWVAGVEGADFRSECNNQTAATLVDWVNQGYISSGYDGVTMDDAALRFGDGSAAYYIGGDWLAQQISPRGGNIGFTELTGEHGKLVATGASSMGWHVSSKTEVLPAAVAFLGELHSPDYAQALADQKRVPITGGDDVTSDDPLLNDDLIAARRLLDDNGQTAYLDWSTDTMYDEFGSRLQELLAGRIGPEDFTEAVQANWAAFQEDR